MQIIMVIGLNFLFAVNIYAVEINDLKKFQEDWKLVSVRYREDVGEIRTIYSNKLAEKSLKKNEIYPVGSIFGKVSSKTIADSKFPSSKMISSAIRYQFMIKTDSKANHGWRFELYDRYWNEIKDETNSQSRCFSCHNLVPERDYVFTTNKETRQVTTNNPFVREKSNILDIKEYVQIGKEINIFNSPEISDNSFDGTLSELVPFLSNQTSKNGLPSLFKTKESYSLVISLKNKCYKENREGVLFRSIIKPDSKRSKIINDYCWSMKSN